MHDLVLWGELFPQSFCVEALTPPEPQNVAIFGDRTLKEIIKLK